MITESIFPNRIFIASIGTRDFFSQDGYLECRNKPGELLFISNEKVSSYVFECVDLYVYNSEAIKIFNGTTGKFEKKILGFELFRNCQLSKCSLLVGDYRQGSPSKLTRLNLQSEQVEWTIDFSRGANCLIDNETAYLQKLFDKSSLYAIELKKGNILWQFDFDQFGSFLDYAKSEEKYSLEQVVGVLDNLLWVLITGGKLLALDIKSGQLMHELDFNQIFEKQYHATSKMLMDKEYKRIIWLTGALIHIDLVSLKCKVVKEFNQGVEKKDKWSFRDRLLLNNKIFFSGDHGMHNPVVTTFLGIMNADTGEIIWHTQLLKCDGIYLGSVRVSRNRIYARDGNGSLHVFEQELDF